MAYAEKYILSFISERGNDYKISILQQGYSGSAVSKKLGVPPMLNIEEGEGRIKGSSLTFALQCDVEGELSGLYTTDNKEFRVDLYRNGTLYWQGYLLPELYSENYIDPPFDVSVTATDQLATLKNLKYQGADEYASLHDIISNILSSTELSLPVIEHMQLHATGATSMLQASYINAAAFAGMSQYDALSAILLSCNASIVQMGCSWLVSSFTCSSGSAARIGQMHLEPICPDGSLTMTAIPAYKGANVVYNHTMRNSMLKNADITSREYWSYAADPKDDGRFPGEIDADDGKRYKCYFWQLHQKNIKNDSGQQLWQDVALKQDAGYSYAVKFKYLLSQDAYMLLLAISYTTVSGTTWRLTASGWTSDYDNANINSYIQVTGEKKNALYIWDVANLNNYEEATVYFSLPEQNGQLRIGFINPTENYADTTILPTAAYVTQVYLTITGITGQQAITEVEPNATTEQQEVELSYGDAVASNNADKLTLNTLSNANGVAYATWQLEGKEYPSYFTAMLQDFSRLMGKRRMQLSGLLQGKELLHNRYFETFSGKIFRLLSGQYDLLQDVMNVVLEEVVTGTVDFDVVIYATEEKSKNQTSSAPGVSTGGGAAPTRVSALEDAAVSDIQQAYMAIDKADWPKEKKILATELVRLLTEGKFLTQTTANTLYAAKSAVANLQTQVSNLADDVSGAVDAADSAWEYAYNANTKVSNLQSTVTSLQTQVSSLANTVSDLEDLVGLFEDRIAALEDMWYYDASENAVRTRYNIIGEQEGAFGD